MNTLVVYESMFGNTRTIAEAIAEALRPTATGVTVTTAAEAPADVAGFDLVVVGSPTHAHTLPQPSSRKDAAAWAEDGRKELKLEEGASRPGVREWLADLSIPDPAPRFAAFSTRADFPRIFSGDAASAIRRRLHKRDVDVDAQMDFLVDFDSHLVDGEQQRAREWALTLVPVTTP
jgi:hypothetical protein